MRVHADEALSQANVAVDRLYIQHYRFKLRGLIIHTEVLLNEEYVLCHTHNINISYRTIQVILRERLNNMFLAGGRSIWAVQELRN